MRSVVRTLLVFAVVAVATWASSVVAGPHKVIVLPLDGTADAATRAKATQLLAKISHASSTGSVTFNETATAAGCDPSEAACAGTVLTMLGADEIVWGTADTQKGQTTITVKHTAKGSPTREASATIAARDPVDKAEPGLSGAFGETPVGSGTDAGPGSGGSGSADLAVGSNAPRSNFFDTRERKLGFGFAAGGGLALIAGIALWASESGLQTQINNHPTNTASDIADLKSLEDRASTQAWEGNLLVVLGLAAGGVGAYYLYKDHENRQAAATVVPAEQGTGLSVVVGGAW